MTLQVSGRGISDIGRKRKNNEDAFLIDDAVGVYVVADGMGGHLAGEVASGRAVKVVHDVVAQSSEQLQALASDPSQAHRTEALALVESAIHAACADIYALATTREDMRGMGTTLVCLVRAGSNAIIGHVGDSRIYLLRAGGVHQLTEDHTLYAEQLKRGALTPEQIARSKFKSVLTRAVGTQESVQVDTLLVELQSGDLFLLCSDGLHGYLADDELPGLIEGMGVHDVAQHLVGVASTRGGKDNITAVVVSIEGVVPAHEVSSKIDYLLRLPLFQHLDYKEAASVLAVSDTREFAAGTVVVREGEEGGELFVVVRGKVAVENGGVVIAALGPGGHFGEMGLMQNAPRSATVRTMEPTVALVTGRAQILELMRRDQTLAVKLLWSFVQVLSQRLRSTNTDLSEARHELEDFESRPTLQPFKL